MLPSQLWLPHPLLYCVCEAIMMTVIAGLCSVSRLEMVDNHAVYSAGMECWNDPISD